MSHPEDQLAAYVDGTLDPDERAVVDAHLATCARCREEVALARRASAALAGLRAPVPVPADVGRRALDEAQGGRRTEPAPEHPRWYRWIGGAAAVAAVILGVAITVPSLVGDDPDRSAEMATADDATGAAGATAPPPPIETIGGNLAGTDLPALVEPVREGTLSGDVADGQAAPEIPAAGSVEFATSGRVAVATECLRTAFPPVTSAPLRVLALRFEGTPAYAGVYFTPADGGTDVDTFQVVVASRRDCTVLSSAVVRA
jgi:hypothetical protein